MNSVPESRVARASGVAPPRNAASRRHSAVADDGSVPPGAAHHAEPAPAAGGPESPGAEDAPRRRPAFIILFVVLAIVVILIGLPILLRLRAESILEQDRYNGFEFRRVAEGNLVVWTTRIETGSRPYDIKFYNHPRDVEDVPLEQGIASWILAPATRPELLYLTFSPDAGSPPIVAGVELSRLTGSRYGLLNIDTRSALQRPVVGVAVEHPVITCADAGNGTVVISFDERGDNIIYRDRDNADCIHLQYSSANESVRVADRLAYALLGIMGG